MDILKYPEKGRFPLEGVVIEWKKKQHDSVQKGEILLQIEAAGQTLEVESTSEGTLLKPLAAVGCPVKAGDSLAIIGDKGQDASKAIAAQPKQTEEKKDQAMTTQTPAGNPENVIPILMPQAGQSMEEGTILSWKIKPGDTIEVGQVIMEIETDKATMEVEAPDAGRVARIIANEGDIIEVKKPVAFIAADDADVDAYLGGAPAAAPAPAAPAPTAPAPAPAAASTPAPAAPSAPAQPAVSVPEGAVVPVLM
ncbi:MAG: lipoyl domain-containing protein, partial [Planctomycetota bacterium]